MIDSANRFALATALVAATLTLGGCAAAPIDELAQARAAVASATPAADASVELARANDKLALARRWMDARDYGPARWLVEQAQVDAELALAKAATEEARRAAANSLPPRSAARKVSLPAL